MRRIAVVLLFFMGYLAFGQMTAQEFEKKYKYDMVHQDRVSVKFQGETYWLRGASLGENVLRLTFFKKNDTPQTFTESLTLVQLYGETLVGFSGKLLDATKSQWIQEPDIIDFQTHLPTLQRTINIFRQDPSNNLVENNLTQLRQAEGGPLEMFTHTQRWKLTTVKKDPNLLSKEAGARAGDWIESLDTLQFTF